MVRFYNPSVPVAGGPAPGPAGAFIVPESEAAGLTAAQVQAKFSLPAPPTMMSTPNAAGLTARSGIAGPLFGQPGGGVQLELLPGQNATFTNPRPFTMIPAPPSTPSSPSGS
jgi:hypothetical protein